MREVVVTGIGLITAAGAGTGPFEEALRLGRPLGSEREVSLPGGRRKRVRFAPLGAWDPAGLLEPRALRKMAPEAQATCAAYLMACRDAGTGDRPLPPERVGTYLGSGFGCMQTTEDYLADIFGEGMATASPFLFSESLASAPLGHAAILLDARGPSIGVACGDASAASAVGLAWREIGKGRLDRAICGSMELPSPALIHVLARLGARGRTIPSIGAGVAALVLEAGETARETGAAILARVDGTGEAADPSARATDWSHDPRAWSAALDAALAPSGDRPHPLRAIHPHEPASEGAFRAEALAVERLVAERGGVRAPGTRAVFGSFAAAGGLGVAAAILSCRSAPGRILVSSGSWGGATAALALSAGGDSR